MATDVTIQLLTASTGQDLTFAAIDIAGGNSISNASKGGMKFFIQTSTSDTVDVTIVSKACSHGRLGDLTKTVGPGKIESFGPYNDASIWGDGSTIQLTYTTTSTTGTIKIAAIK